MYKVVFRLKPIYETHPKATEGPTAAKIIDYDEGRTGLQPSLRAYYLTSDALVNTLCNSHITREA